MLAKRNGQWSVGVLAYHVYVYVFLVVSVALCLALIVVSSTTLHMALGLRIHKVSLHVVLRCWCLLKSLQA